MTNSVQPRARVEMVRDDLFGTTVEDPYRWMEDWHGEELRRWVEAQGAYTRAYLGALPERDALLRRIAELSDTGPLLGDFVQAAGRTFYLRRDEGEEVHKLVMRVGDEAPEEVLFDPATVGGEVHSTIDWLFPSRDGRLVAFGLSPGGSEQSVLHVIEADGKNVLDDSIPLAQFGNVEWLADNRSFLYHRMAQLPEGAPEVDRYKDSQTYLHRLGDDPDRDQAVFGIGASRGGELTRDDFPLVMLSPRSEWMLGIVVHGVQPELTIYAAPLATLADPATIPWVKVVDVDDAVTAPAEGGAPCALLGDTLYVRTARNAPRYKIVSLNLKNPDMERAQVVVPPSDAIVEDMALAGAYLMVREVEAGISRLRRLELESGALDDVPLPMEGTISNWTAAEESGEILLEVESWIVPPRVYRFRADALRLADTGWIPPCAIDFSAVEAHETTYTGHDGTPIPITIVHRKDLDRNGSNPTILLAYGSYGISLSPVFRPSLLAWYERGGVYAVAHIRGGGELGREWHEAGRKLNKQRTIDDFIAAAEYLIQEGYTSPDYLAGWGRSAGGIPSGGSLVKRPDLWAVMVMQVTVTNFLRFEFSENGPPNIPEFGTITTEEGFQALQIIDSYTKIKDGVPYPAALITTGLNDPRVVVWQATKMAARLQAATSSGRPVLLRVEEKGGHGQAGGRGLTKQQVDEELADTLAFLLDQFGSGAARVPDRQTQPVG